MKEKQYRTPLLRTVKNIQLILTLSRGTVEQKFRQSDEKQKNLTEKQYQQNGAID